METIAKYRHARSSAQKVRLVADLIRGKRVLVLMSHFVFVLAKCAKY